MTTRRMDAAACHSVFSAAEGHKETAQQVHTSISHDIDSLSAACVGESSSISSALDGVYNRALTSSMTAAEQQIENAVQGGRAAVAAIQNGDMEMAERTVRDAAEVDQVHILDSKGVAQ